MKTDAQRPLFEEDFPEVRAFMRRQLSRLVSGHPRTKRALGEDAVRELFANVPDSFPQAPTFRALAIRGAMSIAGEELRHVRIRYRELPSISAFYAVVERDGHGRRVFLQAPALGMSLPQAQRVWRRIVRQRDRSDEVATVWSAFVTSPGWEHGAQTVAEACQLAGMEIEVYTEEPGEAAN